MITTGEALEAIYEVANGVFKAMPHACRSDMRDILAVAHDFIANGCAEEDPDPRRIPVLVYQDELSDVGVEVPAERAGEVVIETFARVHQLQHPECYPMKLPLGCGWEEVCQACGLEEGVDVTFV